MKAIRFHQHGGPEVLVFEDALEPTLASGGALVKIEAIGLNYIDTYHRTGLYPVELPCIPGSEAAGTVTAVADDVSVVKVGDRVAYAMVIGSYGEYAAVDAERLVALPDKVDFEVGAAALLQGMTAHYLVSGCYPLGEKDIALIHAAAGGVGLLLVQLAKRIGARVIATVSTEEKEQLARQAGADEVILYTEKDFEEEVGRIVGDGGVDVVYDSVGKSTFEKGLNLLRPRGYMVLFGQSSGAVEPLNPGILAAKGSLFLTRPTLGSYLSTRQELLSRAGDILKWLGTGELKLRIGHRFPLADAAEAHRALEGRKTSGKVLLIP